MAYTTTDLITSSYYTSGKVARSFQTVSGEDMSDGLSLLNDLLGVKTADNLLIPYYTEHTFNTVAQTSTYTVENLLKIDTLTFNLASVRYPTQMQSRTKFYGTGRANNVYSLPVTYRPERTLGGMQIEFYFPPDQIYTITIWGKFGLATAVLGQDLSTIYDRYYITYLRYALAEYICEENAIPAPTNVAQKLLELEKIIKAISPPDISRQKRTQFGGQGTLNYAQINLGGGWTPP